MYNHGLWTLCKEIVFTAQPKMKSQFQIYRYSRSIFCLPHRPKISGFSDTCLHWVSVVRVYNSGKVKKVPGNKIAITIYSRTVCINCKHTYVLKSLSIHNPHAFIDNVICLSKLCKVALILEFSIIKQKLYSFFEP